MKLITEIHEESRGRVRVAAGPRRAGAGPGRAVNRKRVARLMRDAGCRASTGARAGRTWSTRRPRRTWCNRASSRSTSLDRLWLTDITEHPTAEGKVYCAAVMDACSRRIIGWSIDCSQKTELVVDAIGMAILRRRPAGESTILHSDHGTQYTSWAFGKRLREAGLLGSMGTVGDCYDNSMMESFWGTMQTGASRPEGMEIQERAGECDLRMDRMLV